MMYHLHDCTASGNRNIFYLYHIAVGLKLQNYSGSHFILYQIAADKKQLYYTSCFFKKAASRQTSYMVKMIKTVRDLER